MHRLHRLILLLGLTLLAAQPAFTAARHQAEKVASGSAAVLEILALENAPLSAERTGENLVLGYDFASGSSVAAKGVGSAAQLAKQLGSKEGVAELLSGGGKAIAGAGTKVPIRDVGRLISEYGGKAEDWIKVTSTAPGHLQTHAYRNLVTGEVVELKSILP